jgi:adenosine deaminase
VTLAKHIPKIHLHCHLEGSLRPTTFVELAAAYGVPLRYDPHGSDESAWVGSDRPPVDPADPYRFKDFGEFLLTFAAASRSLARPQDYARLAREFVEDALAQNVIYGELFVSPSVWTFFNRELNVRESFAAMVAELRAAQPRATFKLIVDLTRNFGPESAMRTAHLAASLTDLDVIGVGLGGDEARFPPENYAEPFAYARAQGLHCVAHAGEAAGAQSVRNAVEVLHAERIGHGVAALDDPATLELLASKGIAVEICPTSNSLTGAAPLTRPTYAEFDRAGCVVTIDSDDPAMFKTSIEHEYAIVEAAAGADALERFVRNAADASFADAQAKRAMRDAISNQGRHVGA